MRELGAWQIAFKAIAMLFLCLFRFESGTDTKKWKLKLYTKKFVQSVGRLLILILLVKKKQQKSKKSGGKYK